MANKFDANKILDELLTDSLGCVRYIKKNEALNISMISKDDIELKRLKAVPIIELELIEKELESKEDEINWDSFWEKINEYKLEKSTKIVFYICTEYLGWLEL